MSTPPPPSPLAEGLSWSFQISTLAMELCVCAGIGWWLDRRFGTAPWLALVGSVLGLAITISHLRELVRRFRAGNIGRRPGR